MIATRARLTGFCLALAVGLVTLRSMLSMKFEEYRYRNMFSSVAHNVISIADDRSTNKVLCWIPMLSVKPDERARLLGTWGRRCNKFYFVAMQGSLDDDIIAHEYVRKDKFDLWNQVHRGWARIAELHLDDYEWFLKLDADTYFNVDNFRWLLREKNWTAESVVYFGRTIFEQSRPVKQIRAQFNLGAGYGVSRRVLRMMYPFLPKALNSTLPAEKRCPEWERWGEDVKFADCLRYVFPNFLPNSTRDRYHRETFMPLPPESHILMQYPPWVYRGNEVMEAKHKGSNCCSSRPVLWHGMRDTPWFLILEYLHQDVAIDPMSIVSPVKE